jgi:AcrR family transcriptional regulator
VTVNVGSGTVGHMSSGAVLEGDGEALEIGPPARDATLSRRDRRTARTHQAIVDAARELIDEQGFAETTIDQIADRADVAPRTFFRHFASKEALLFSHFEEQRRRMIELIAARPVDEHPFRSALEGLAAFCEIVVEQREHFSWAFRIMHEHDLVYEKTMLKAETCERVSQFIAQRLGVDPAEDPRPHAWAVMAMTLFGNAMKRALEPGGNGQPGQCFRTLVDQTAEGFVGAAFDRPAPDHRR